MRHIHKFVAADELLADAARAAQRAAKACREWEQGGLSEAVGASAEVAFSAASKALASIEMEDEADLTAGLPET